MPRSRLFPGGTHNTPPVGPAFSGIDEHGMYLHFDPGWYKSIQTVSTKSPTVLRPPPPAPRDATPSFRPSLPPPANSSRTLPLANCFRPILPNRSILRLLCSPFSDPLRRGQGRWREGALLQPIKRGVDSVGEHVAGATDTGCGDDGRHRGAERVHGAVQLSLDTAAESRQKGAPRNVQHCPPCQSITPSFIFRGPRAGACSEVCSVPDDVRGSPTLPGADAEGYSTLWMVFRRCRAAGYAQHSAGLASQGLRLRRVLSGNVARHLFSRPLRFFLTAHNVIYRRSSRAGQPALGSLRTCSRPSPR